MSDTPKNGPVWPSRYLAGRTPPTRSLIDAARDYVSRKSGSELEWLYRKPFDPAAGHPALFDELSTALNLIKALNLPPRCTVAEVGSGPGWLTELLVLLGYHVISIEPAESMITIARYRVSKALEHHRVTDARAVEFVCSTIEDCRVASGCCDAVLFHAALHHVIDEAAAIRQAYRILRPGGQIAVSEDAWRPGDSAQERELDEEMRRFATLESPFTQRYLDSLLADAGFVALQRYISVGSLVPVEQAPVPVVRFASSPPSAVNHVIARKPGGRGPTTMDGGAGTSFAATVLAISWTTPRVLRLVCELSNTGRSTWLAGSGSGTVHLALCGLDRTTGVACAEAEPRCPLPEAVPPGARVTLATEYVLPDLARDMDWALDLVAEDRFWFSGRSGRRIPVCLPSTEPLTAAEFAVVRTRWLGQATLAVTANVTNRGSEVWLDEPGPNWITIALRTDDFVEAAARVPLPRPILPSESVELELRFEGVPPSDRWVLDLVCEGCYWFSERGVTMPIIRRGEVE